MANKFEKMTDDELNLDLKQFADREIEKRINTFTYTDLVVLILSLLFMFAYAGFVLTFHENNNNIFISLLLAIIAPFLSVILSGIMYGIIGCFKYCTRRLRKRRGARVDGKQI